jgi:hypothetical protein
MFPEHSNAIDPTHPYAPAPRAWGRRLACYPSPLVERGSKVGAGVRTIISSPLPRLRGAAFQTAF